MERLQRQMQGCCYGCMWEYRHWQGTVINGGVAVPSKDCRRARAAGFDHHVGKPPDLNHLQRLFGAKPEGTDKPKT